LITHPNVPTLIARVVASRLATLHELDTVYSVQDLHDLNEIIVVESYNNRIMNTPREG